MGQQPFEALVTAHHGEIHRYLLRVTSRGSEADDLAQETFVRAYRAYRRLAPDANVRAWLFAIATNLSRNYFRSESRRRRAHGAVQATRTGVDRANPEDETRFRETRELLESAVAVLPPKQRLAFIMRKVHELEYDVIAESLHCSADSARAHVFQALRKIRIRLNGHELHVTERPHEC
jgi:RNA polymerase sigma-70 factor (ECF subfamily)